MEYYTSDYIEMVESSNKISALSSEIHRQQLAELKKQEETRLATEHFKDVISFVAKTKRNPEISVAQIYLTNNAAIDRVKKWTKQKVTETAKSNSVDKELISVLQSNANAFISCKGFFSTLTKEIFIVEDIHNRYYYSENFKKTKDRCRSIKEYYIPKRFTMEDWLKKEHRSTAAHELFHLHYDMQAPSAGELSHEEYAYSNQIDWCRHDGLKDEEIINGSVKTFGMIMCMQKDPTLRLKERKKELKKAAIDYAWDMMRRYDASRNNDATESKDYFEISDIDLDIEL